MSSYVRTHYRDARSSGSGGERGKHIFHPLLKLYTESLLYWLFALTGNVGFMPVDSHARARILLLFSSLKATGKTVSWVKPLSAQ